MSKRINIMLPETTLAVLDRVAPKGARSHFIAKAVQHYVRTCAGRNLRELLKQEALANSQRDLEIAQEWFALEQEVWQPKRRSKRG
jgi:CopG family transcriptional regulator/antitoxin EndoAI